MVCVYIIFICNTSGKSSSNLKKKYQYPGADEKPYKLHA